MSSTNHYSTGKATTLWWRRSQQDQEDQNPSTSSLPNIIHPWNHHQQLNDEEDDENDVVLEDTTSRGEREEEKEAMFEKPLTPSDVGKLNRLVIPKQHAEKYFPLENSEEINKGLLLSFEDESGKCWRFRYSYWNSSQSYVLTKGWSRYVKDKKLDAGDVVLFHRHRTHSQRFFINWRKRHHLTSSNARGGGFYPYPTHHQLFNPYHAVGGSQGQKEEESTASGAGGSSSKVLRLFGVNMECQPDNITHSQT